MHYNDATTYPQTGWGQMLPLFLKEGVNVYNFAMNGASTKTFIELGYYEKSLKKAEKGDVVIIQFGHNDAKLNSERYTDPFTTYKENLKHFINDFKKKGCNVILATSIYRRHFKDGILNPNCHGDYPKAMMEVSEEENVLLIDMCNATKKIIENLKEENSISLFMIFDPNVYENYPEGKYDNTHLRPDGAYIFCKAFVEDIKKTNHILNDWLN